MTEQQKQEAHDKRVIEVMQNQRNNALNEIVGLCGRIAWLEVENIELKAEIEALKAPVEVTVVPKKKGVQP